MGALVFENQLFDHWLNKKSQDILAKMDKEQVTTEDMLILSLKAQTNHFHHMDVEFREEFNKIDKKFELMDQKFDKRFDRMTTIMMWQGGILATLISGLYIKLFFVQ